jgi:hypothetical protein
LKGKTRVQPRVGAAVAVNRVFRAYLTADMLIGALCYRAQIGFLTGWVHHVVYIGITETAVRKGVGACVLFVCGYGGVWRFLSFYAVSPMRALEDSL